MERGRGITYLNTSKRDKTRMAHICAQLMTRGDQPEWDYSKNDHSKEMVKRGKN